VDFVRIKIQMDAGEENEKEIRRKYLSANEPGAFTSMSTFLKSNKFKKDEAESALSNLKTYSIHKPIRINYPRRKVIVNFIDDTWALDLAVFESTKRSNSFFAYIMFVSDIFSRFTWSIPLKKKDTQSVLDGFKSLFDQTTRVPKKIWSDSERSFFSKEVVAYLKSKNIKIYHSFSKLKSVYSELTVKHLKSRIYKYLTHNRTKNWLKGLADITHSYNHTHQKLLGMAPAEVNISNQHIIWHRKYHSIIDMDPPRSKLKVGDLVRIGRSKIELGRKAYDPNWSDEIFRIKSIKKTRPVLSFVLEDLSGEKLQGSFLEPELNLVSNSNNSITI